jgi:BirA family biotin operon repressor/biotin-[acetyl-CoA-carboxylase] ligase
MARRFYPYKKLTISTRNGKVLAIEKYRELPFTNDVLKGLARTGAYEGRVIIADRQTSPRGALDKKHFGDDSSGLHMSILLRPGFGVKRSLMLTSMAAVAVVRAIKEHSDLDEEIGINWVSDIIYKKKKMAAILAEGAINSENGFDYVILGISVKLLSSVFPPKLTDIVAEIFSENHEGLIDKMARSILKSFFDMYESFGTNMEFLDEYREMSLLTGRRVHVLANNVKTTAVVNGITDDAHLSVILKDGSEYILNSTGELLIGN